MSIQMALNSALSGLKAAQQQAGLASHNIANATTPGFVRKTLAVSAAVTGGSGQGVRADGVLRGVDELLLRDARFEVSRYTALEARAEALSTYTQVLGQPQEERSVASALSRFQQAYQSLFDMPESDGARAGVVEKATQLAARIRDAAGAATAIQADARDRLQGSVGEVNAALHEVSRLNAAIATGRAGGADVSDLQDQRDVQLDRIAREIGIRTFTREGGDVVVMTRQGRMLLESGLAPGAQPLQVVGNALVIGGVDVTADRASEVQSGRLMGLLDIAEGDVPTVLAQLDSLAAGLVRGFQDAEADPTQAGLFTDGAGAFAAEAGLASRIAVNPAVEGNAWRVQSGVQAAAPLPKGDTTQVARFLGVFRTDMTFSAPGLPAISRLEGYAVSLVSGQHSGRAAVETDMAARRIAAETLNTARINRDGVNVDEEMQKLMLIEQAYGASAQVIQTAGRMIETLLQLKS
ncbi:flagellar hook-associated protein FlgK [Arenibaculum sp.]|jgi:flagellar hook-associated protein 1 FlgK|uniref:flagellar hook-associated protein FlgK n=1 Tax=Arenibaculum sp. TaxID=2865862 RepID=UPI002E148502|nr:flagellar hook-associated protein FlgK [Arenibaculum sp.]